jgi:hypothetical protein
MRKIAAAFASLTLLLVACHACASVTQSSRSSGAVSAPSTLVPVDVESSLLRLPSSPCTGSFVTHLLDHRTTTSDDVIRMFEANGAGAAAGDLDNDGDLDLLLGNLDFPNTLLWNEGNLHFRRQPFAEGNTRAITLVDVDADGWLDIVLTRGNGVLNYWRNQHHGQFNRQTLSGVNRLAYVLNWDDVDADGDLDLVTATYDAGLLIDRGNEYLLNANGGVVYYRNDGGRFHPTVLDPQAMALALALFDVNGDGRRDIMVGNDFAVPDQVWLNRLAGWQVAQMFAETSHSTMSLDWGDISNAGEVMLFSTDMQPYDISPANMAAWLPVIAQMEDRQGPEDVQRMANMLQRRSGRGVWRNQAEASGVAATGWSWSGKFGDLDNDGYLDLYVVNGMIEERMWAHLPNQELVEENQALRNDGGGRFLPMPEWKLNSTASGRSLIEADFDQDGDLDLVVNNLRAPAQLFENQLCGGQSLELELSWPQVQNRHAIGASVTLFTGKGRIQRQVRTASGYLSGDPVRLHFGFPEGAPLDRLEIDWPDGASSQVASPPPAALLRIRRR